MKPKLKITAYLPEKDLKALKSAARKAGQSLSEVVRDVLRAHLNKN